MVNRWPSARDRRCLPGQEITPANRVKVLLRSCVMIGRERTPTAAYWRPVTIVEDTRLAALKTDTNNFTFKLPSGNAATINVQLVYRRSFQKLAEQKGWTDPDLIMAEKTIQVEK